MKKIVLLIVFSGLFYNLFAAVDSVIVPINRQYFHDKIMQEQKLCDQADGKLDGKLRISNNDEINLQVTDVLYRKVNELKDWVETDSVLATNNEKVRYLSYIENMLKYFRVAWKVNHGISPLEISNLYNVFDDVIKAQANGASIIPYIQQASYPVAKINSEVFFDNKEIKTFQNIVYLKFCTLNPDKILETIKPFAKESFADSLVVVACKNNPVQLYSFAQSVKSAQGQLIHRNTNSMVIAVVKLSQTPNALFYFPFLDDILSGKKTIDDIKKFVGDGEKGYDSVGYYKLLVKTEIEYFKRMAPPQRDTPIAMFGANGLRQTLYKKALQHFISPINALHDQSNLAVRMRAIQPLSAEELYYMIVLGENDIYTSSYKHSYDRMVQLMGAKPRGDSLLLNVNFDYFKKFLKMAANYNRLDTFLKMMPAASSEILMKAFVANLDKGTNLEDAVDVADSYSSINDKKLQHTILEYVKENEQKCIAEDNQKGKIVYGLLKTIMLSADTRANVDLTSEIGIPSIYEIANKDMQDDKGRIIEQVFFYGDEDGKAFFPKFVNSFPAKDWQQTMKKEWVELKSVKGNITVFANRPLDYNENLDDSAQVHLGNYLKSLDMHPSMVVHRGHSYWLPGTIDRMPGDAKIIVLGSCGGYQNLNEILKISPDAHIISTKEIGTGDINQPIINYINQTLISGKTLSWKSMWGILTKTMESDPSKAIRESWDDYIPPYKNLGAIFIKAYHKKMESEGLN
jgi:hypothetical protein